MLPRPLALLCVALSTARGLAFYPVADKKLPSPAKNALKKRSGALTVSVEVTPSDVVAPIDAGELAGDGRRTVELTPDERLAKLSSELRGGRSGALCATLWTSCVDAVAVLAKEQASAKGDFPGPVSYTHLTLPTICSV